MRAKLQILALAGSLACALLMASPLGAQRPERPTPTIAGYVIDAELDPAAPQFTIKYAVYRLGNNKGFRIIGEIDQDLDLFRMPVELRVETDGKTETQKVNLVGASTQFVVDTFGRPRRISIDPQN